MSDNLTFFEALLGLLLFAAIVAFVLWASNGMSFVFRVWQSLR
jgi:hypothetical protein